MAYTQVLSLDGGGVRGILTARILQGLEDVKDGPASDYFDAIYGTSTGSLIAAGLTTSAVGTAKKVVELYLQWAPQIFHQTYLRECYTADGWDYTKYSDEGLIQTLQAFAGDEKFVNLKRQVCFPAYDLTQKKTIWFSRDEAQKRGWTDLPLASVLRATTAAPTYFEGKITILDGVAHRLVDGGLNYNNPVRRVVVDACALSNRRPEMTILSVGNGYHDSVISDAVFTHGGTIQWANTAFSIMNRQQEIESTFEASQILSDPARLMRIEPELAQAIALDDASKLDELVRAASDWLADNDDKFRNICAQFKRIEA